VVRIPAAATAAVAAPGVFLFFKSFRPTLELASPVFNGDRGIPPSLGGRGDKRLRREADHSPPSSPQLKSDWRCSSSPLYGLMVCTATNLPFTLWKSKCL
jgi:hypothetical protein